MKYREYKVGFTFDMPDQFSEVRESSYEVFDVEPNTLKYFIVLDDDGEIIRSFSFNRDAEEVKTDKQYQEAVDNNVELLTDMGYTVVVSESITTDKGRVIDRVIFTDLDQEETIGIAVYFTRIKNTLVVSSCFITEFFDENESEMFDIYYSIEEL